MTLTFKIDDFLYEIFPVKKGDLNELIAFIKDYFTDDYFEPNVEIFKNQIEISFDYKRRNEDKKKHQELIYLCENGQFHQAKALAKELISKSPNISEYHRILGQILSDEGDQEEAINCLIDALRWDPKNVWALLMMANIFAKYKGDVNTAMKYYDQVLVIKPNDNIALNNIGANLMQLGKIEEAMKYFIKALDINPDYPNTHYALSFINQMKRNWAEAFEYALSAIEFNNRKDDLYRNSINIAIDSAQKLIQLIDADNIINTFTQHLESISGKPIKIVTDENIPTAAKIEFAENYDRDHHLVKYKPSYPAKEHLVLHELIHLEFVSEARTHEANQLFITKQTNRKNFFLKFEKFAEELNSKGISEESIANYFDALFDGINRQVFNTPIDLFIEDRIFKDFSELKPFQFLSLVSIIQEGIQATTDSEIILNVPKTVLSKSKIFNLVNAMHFKSLYKIDLIQEHNPSKEELNQANDLYKEFLEYREDRSPGEEYELIQHWAEDLRLDNFFELVPENEYKRKGIDDVISEIENDPYNLEAIDPSKERKMKKFLDSHNSAEINHAVVMYMVAAIELFKTMEISSIKEIAFQFATLGMTGIDPNKKGYSIPFFKNKNFTGYQALAYYYTSWAVAIPEMIHQLQMPFDEEYKLAKRITELNP